MTQASLLISAFADLRVSYAGRGHARDDDRLERVGAAAPALSQPPCIRTGVDGWQGAQR